MPAATSTTPPTPPASRGQIVAELGEITKCEFDNVRLHPSGEVEVLKAGVLADGHRTQLPDLVPGRMNKVREETWAKAPVEVFEGVKVDVVNYVLLCANTGGLFPLAITAIGTQPPGPRFKLPSLQDAETHGLLRGQWYVETKPDTAEACRRVMSSGDVSGAARVMQSLHCTFVNPEHPGVKLLLSPGTPLVAEFTGEALHVPMQWPLLKACVLCLEAKAVADLARLKTRAG